MNSKLTAPSLSPELVPLQLPPEIRVEPLSAVSAWAKRAIAAQLPTGGCSVNLGCGAGDWLQHLACRTGSVIGVESDPLLARKASAKTQSRIVSGEAAALRLLPLAHRHDQPLVVQADPIAWPIQAAQRGLEVASVFSAFLSSSLPHPREVFSAAHAILGDLGVLIFVGHLFVRESDFESRSITRAMHNRGALPVQQLVGPMTPFEQIILAPGAPIRQRRFAHDLRMHTEALQPSLWRVLDLQVYSADGCQHVAPECPAEAGPQQPLLPNPDLSLMTIGIVAQKRVHRTIGC